MDLSALSPNLLSNLSNMDLDTVYARLLSTTTKPTEPLLSHSTTFTQQLPTYKRSILSPGPLLSSNCTPPLLSRNLSHMNLLTPEPPFLPRTLLPTTNNLAHMYLLSSTLSSLLSPLLFPTK